MDGKVLALLQDKLGLEGEADRRDAAKFYEDCSQLLRQGSETETILQSQNDEETQAAAVAWIVRWLLNRQGGGRLPLSDILACAGTNLVAFFREVPVALARLRPYLASAAGGRADSVEQGLRLRECQETLVSLTILAKKYKDLFWRVQKAAAVPQPQALQAGWLTFLLLKAQLLQQYPDLVSCLQLLVCVLGCYVASMPYGDAEVRALMEQNPAAIDAGGRLNTLKLLSAAARADYAQVAALVPTVEARLRALLAGGAFAWLPPAGGPPAPHPLAATLAPVCGLHAPGMLSDRRQLSDLVLFLDSSYQAEYDRAGEIDEREFLTTDFGALASPRAALGGTLGCAPAGMAGGGGGAAAANGGAAAAYAYAPPGGAPQLAKPPLAPGGGLRRPISLGLQSPLPIMHLGPPAPATPITQAMGSVTWLRGVTKDCAAEPSAALRALLAAAGPDADQVLVARVQEAADAVFGPLPPSPPPADAPAAAAPGGGGAAGGGGAPAGAGAPAPAPAAGGWAAAAPSLHASVARERREEGLRLYWHALEAMVAASYRMGALCFPAVPERLGLAPFDLTKIIPAFVRALPSLPRELKRHLFTVEEKVVEALGWQAGSSLYGVLAAAVGDGGGAPAAEAEAADKAGGGGGAGPMDTSAVEAATQESQQAAEEEEQGAAAAAAQQQQDGEHGEKQQQRQGAGGGAAAPMEAESGSASGGSQPAPSGSSWSPSGTAEPARGGSSCDEPSSKRRRGGDGAPLAGAAPERPAGGAALPHAVGAPPDGGAAAAAGAPAGSDPAARAVMFDFCRKVLKLAAFRLVAISEGLDFAPMERDDVLAAVHDVVSHALYYETHLFYGRHLDQLLLAALYGYCKVNRLGSITFKEIISHYRRQPHARQEVFRTVALRRAEPSLAALESGDIIAFYNRVFVPSLKSHLLRRCVGAGAPGGGGGGGSAAAAPGARAGGGGASGVSAASAVAKHLQPGHINRSPIFTALQHAASQQQAAAAALPAGGVTVKRSVGVRPPAPAHAPGGTAYRTLSLDSGASLGGLGGLHGFGGGHGFAGSLSPGGGGAGGGGGGGDNSSGSSGGGAPGLAALAAVAADGSGPAGRGGPPLGGKPSLSGHHVARAYVPSRLGRGGGPPGGGGGTPGGGGGLAGAGLVPKPHAPQQWGLGGGSPGPAGYGAAPSPTRRGGRVLSPRGPVVIGAPALSPAASADVAQCPDQSGAAAAAAGGSGGAPPSAGGDGAPRPPAGGAGSPFSAARASPSSVRRVGAKRQPMAGGGGGGGAAAPSGLATLLQALESTTAMELDGSGGAAATGGGGAAGEPAAPKEAAAVGQAAV
ncbi:MAG: hypothetical protein J3K34DRAFT_502383 [Monoraphidium minutum]|nr:MAG: hypothetical protein J3K34DRAFT_502383 [Monoraphidium minutum]